MDRFVDCSELREIVKEYFDAGVLLQWDQKEEKDLESYFAGLVRRKARKQTFRLPDNTPDKFLGSLAKLKSLKYVEIYFKEDDYGGVYNLMDLACFDRLDVARYLLSQERIYICQRSAEAVCNRDLASHPKYIELLRVMITTGESLTPPVLSWKKGFINRMLLRWQNFRCDHALETIMILNNLGFPLDGEAYELMKPYIKIFEKTRDVEKKTLVC